MFGETPSRPSGHDAQFVYSSYRLCLDGDGADHRDIHTVSLPWNDFCWCVLLSHHYWMRGRDYVKEVYW